MMKRHTKEQIAKNPDLKNRDILEAKRACESLKDKPFALLNYVEGTRFSPKKRDAQGSPYQHLLKPKAGGLSLAMRALGKQVDGILDMTIVYPDGAPDYNDLWEGEVKRLGVHVQRIDVPEKFMDSGTDEELDDATKQALYAWLDDLWQQKDARITKMLAEFDNSLPNH